MKNQVSKPGETIRDPQKRLAFRLEVARLNLDLSLIEHRIQDTLRGRKVHEGWLKEYLTDASDTGYEGFTPKSTAEEIWQDFLLWWQYGPSEYCVRDFTCDPSLEDLDVRYRESLAYSASE